MLSFSSLLNADPTAPAQHPIDDRGEHISYSPPWKGGASGGGKKKGTQSALSALTLLAFLFFLNMLQHCLQDQMNSNAPVVVMMTTTTTTTTTVEGQRQKREEPVLDTKGDTGNNNLTKLQCPSQDCASQSERNPSPSPYDYP